QFRFQGGSGIGGNQGASSLAALAMLRHGPASRLTVRRAFQACGPPSCGIPSTGRGVASGVENEHSLDLAVLDFVGIEYGESASASVAGAVGIAQTVEAAGYRRYWVSEHHNMRSLACSAPELLTAHVGARTSRIRVGAAGIMLPNHAPLKVAETFRTLLAMYPGRIDLALGRAPGTDPLTAHVLRRGMVTDPAAEFPGQVAELLAWLADDFPAGHPYEQLVAAPVVAGQPQLFVLGSSGYGPRFAAVNGMSAAFAHHMSPEIAFESLRGYRREFRARTPGATPYSAMSVLAFASEDAEAVLDFEAAWTLTIHNLRRGVREPLRPEQVTDLARSAEFRSARRDDGRMVTGEPKAVAERLLEMKEQSEADEIVIVTPSLDRDRRKGSYTALADAWRRAR
ncbi:MAG: LLM class flavin-dependent oxidoreductase, partial [Streptosporangiaceae bacterium]